MDEDEKWLRFNQILHNQGSKKAIEFADQNEIPLCYNPRRTKMPTKKCPAGKDRAHLVPSKATKYPLGEQNIICQDPTKNRDSGDDRALYRELRRQKRFCL